jgi:hypothetical protein
LATHTIGLTLRRYDTASLGSHRGPLAAFFNTPTREPARSCKVGFGNSLRSLLPQLALTQANFRFAPPAQIGVIPANGDLLDGEAVDLPSAAGDTNDLLRLSSFWPPISEAA